MSEKMAIFSLGKPLQAASDGTLQQLSSSTVSAHVVYTSPEGAPLVYSLISFAAVGDLLLLAVQDDANAIANLDCVMAESVQLDNGDVVIWSEVALNGVPMLFFALFNLSVGRSWGRGGDCAAPLYVARHRCTCKGCQISVGPARKGDGN